MCRAGATKTHHRIVARVFAFFNQVNPCRCGHALHHHFVDPQRRLLHRQAQGVGHAGNSPLRRRQIQLHSPTQKETGVVITQHQIGVGHGWLDATLAITGRTRRRTCRARANFEQTHLVYGRDGAATRANFNHLNDGRLDRQARATCETVDPCRLHHRRDLGAAVLNQASLGGGAAHVERNHVRLTGQ